MAKKKAERRMPRTLNATLYCYVEKDNERYAKTEGKKLFGSFSSYVNALIAKDRGVTPSLGSWKAPGETKVKAKRSVGKKSQSLSERAGLVSPLSDSTSSTPNANVKLKQPRRQSKSSSVTTTISSTPSHEEQLELPNVQAEEKPKLTAPKSKPLETEPQVFDTVDRSPQGDDEDWEIYE